MSGTCGFSMKYLPVLRFASFLSRNLAECRPTSSPSRTVVCIRKLQHCRILSADAPDSSRSSLQPQFSQDSLETWSSQTTDEVTDDFSLSKPSGRKPRHSSKITLSETSETPATEPGMMWEGERASRRVPQDTSQGDTRRITFVNYLQLTDAEILKQCQMDTYRASGPGGQHRNKTESAVRLRHGPTGLSSQSCEERSQHINKTTALKRLRQNLALKVRNVVDLTTYTPSADLLRILPASALSKMQISGKQRIGPNHPDFLNGARELLDVVAAVQGSVSDAATALGVSTGALSKVITSDKMVLQEVNDLRALKGLKHLR